MTNWKDIFKKETDLSNEELLKYLDNDISEEEMNAIEQKMAASDFENDALEGLAQFKTKENITTITNSLNQQLKKQISRSTKRKKKRKIQDQQWLIVVILAVLLLSVAGYFLIHYNH
jgi:ferric-dicitrate binding protein FerR (iron transport regulator)